MIYRRRAAEQKRRALESRMEEVDELVNQVQPKKQKFTRTDPEYRALEEQLKEKVEKVEKAINDLEQRYRENSKHSEYVGSFCDRKRIELTFWKAMCAIQLIKPLKSETEMMKMKEEVGKILECLKHEAYKQKRSVTNVLLVGVCIHVESYLQEIETWCSDKRKEPNMMDGMEARLDEYEKWCKEKKNELEKYRDKIISAGSSKENLTAGNSEGGESTPLNRV
ncbi:hypothetical protein PGIGA_G00144740 [Pangasianodon gigas]|uniref:Uncharacterized protein n=1 Tax=Pangasianodon gigas TaxID=30993 RepID=A0ACC5XMC2_PANGG|nr:hypothetical protein [Pangasianodon gigas]